MWHLHYDRLCLHTVKQLSHLPHMPFPEGYPTYVTREQLCQYFEDYARSFEINPLFDSEVSSVLKTDDNLWLVETTDGRKWHTQHAIVCIGINRVPNEPTWPGMDTYRGNVIHSRWYKNSEPYTNRQVLVVGMGNTGAEIALDLAENGVAVDLSVRSAVNIVPRDINGRPTQLTARQLAKLPFGLGDWLGTQIRKLIIGDLRKYGLQTKSISPMVQLRETGVTPVIDLGTVAQIKKGNIKIKADIDHFMTDRVHFKDGAEQRYDDVILATGYRAMLTDVIPGIESILDKYQIPRMPCPQGQFRGLHFIGYDNYKLGGILGTIYTDSESVCNQIVTSLSKSTKVS